DFTFVPTKIGSYMITVEGRDARGNNVSKVFYSYVSTNDQPYFSGDGYDALTISTDKQKYGPTDTARLDVFSQIPDRDVFLSMERGRVNRFQILHLNGKKGSVEMPLTDTDILNLKYYTFIRGHFAGIDNVIISATGYTGAGGVEIYFEDKDGAADTIWDAIFTAGADRGIKPIGLGARDTLRLEMGFCLYGNDIDDSTSPLEAGLGWITKFSKDFTNKAFFEKQKETGIRKKLVGFEMQEKGIARHDHQIKDFEGSIIGRVSSGTQSPSLAKAIGMGYVDMHFASVGSEIYISIRNSLLKAKVVKMPFS
ncbi:MAG: glycine cleavage T C-terminal barrel domain-containing protein, partial [Ferruginibacter sp.]